MVAAGAMNINITPPSQDQTPISTATGTTITDTPSTTHTALVPVSAPRNSCVEASCATSANPSYDYLAEKVCMLLMIRKPEEWGITWASEEQEQQWAALMGAVGMTIVEAEVRTSMLGA